MLHFDKVPESWRITCSKIRMVIAASYQIDTLNVWNSCEQTKSDGGQETRESLGGTASGSVAILYRNGSPQGGREVQNGLGLSSSSVASYHLKRLLEMGLIKESEKDSSKYFVDRVVFENMTRFRRALIPIQIGYLAFFGCALAILLVVFRPQGLVFRISWMICEI